MSLSYVVENFDWYLYEGQFFQQIAKKINNVSDLKRNKSNILKGLKETKEKLKQEGVDPKDVLKSFKQANINFFKKIKKDDPDLQDKFIQHIEDFAQKYVKQKSLGQSVIGSIFLFLVYLIASVAVAAAVSFSLANLGFPEWSIFLWTYLAVRLFRRAVYAMFN